MSEWDARVDSFVGWIQTVSGGDVVLPYSPPQDASPPRLSFAGLQDGQELEAGMQVVELRASDDVGVTRVELVIDGALAGQMTHAPYRFNIDLDPGAHVLNARAHDASGKTTTATITVHGASSTPPPSPPPQSGAPQVEILWPGAGSRISTHSTVQVSIRGAVSSVILAIDGAVADLKRVGPFTFPISLTPGEHDLIVVAEDPQGRVGRATIHVQADANQQEVAPPPTLGGDDLSYQLRGGCSLGRQGGDLGGGASMFLLPLVLLVLRRSRRR